MSVECIITSGERVLVGSRFTESDLTWVTFPDIRKMIFLLPDNEKKSENANCNKIQLISAV